MFAYSALCPELQTSKLESDASTSISIFYMKMHNPMTRRIPNRNLLSSDACILEPALLIVAGGLAWTVTNTVAGALAAIRELELELSSTLELELKVELTLSLTTAVPISGVLGSLPTTTTLLVVLPPLRILVTTSPVRLSILTSPTSVQNPWANTRFAYLLGDAVLR